MRILINSINYYPELTGIGKYSGEMAEWLSRNGHNVRVVAAPPYYPEWSIAKGYNSCWYKKEIINEVKVWRCPLYVPSKPSGFTRLLHLVTYAVSSFPVLLLQLFWRPQVIITIEPPLFSAPFVWVTARMFRAKCWLHIQDYEVDAAFDLGILSSQRLRRVVLCVERWLLKKFDVVSTISTPMMKRLDQKGVLSNKQILFPNWADIGQIFPIEGASLFRIELGIKDSTIVALYSGNMGEKQGIEIIIDAALSLRENKDIVFVMCGTGAALPRMQKLAEGLNNILWLPLQPVDRLNDLLNMADIHLLPQRADAADLVMPSKLTGMLASGRPVLSTVNERTQIAEVLENSGIIVPPGDSIRLSRALVDLANDPRLRVQLGKNAREYAVEHMGLEVILRHIEQVLCELSLKKS